MGHFPDGNSKLMQCAACGRNFGSALALAFHIEESPACENFIDAEVNKDT